MYYIDISYNSLCTFDNNSLDGVSTQSRPRNPVFEVVQPVSRAIKSFTLSTVQHAKHSSPRSNANRPGQSSATVTRSRSPPARRELGVMYYNSAKILATLTYLDLSQVS